MFELLKRAWRTLTDSTPKNSETAEPASRPRWRPNRKYTSRRECDAAYRERQKLKADPKSEVAPVETVAPEIVPNLPAPGNKVPSSFLFNELRGLIHPGVSGVRPVPLIVETKSVEPVPVSEPQMFEVNATATESPMAVQAIEPTPASTEWEPDWEQEARTDLPMRDPAYIVRLIPFEDDARREARIWNDKLRYQYQRSHMGLTTPDVQSAIVSGTSDKDNRVARWVKRG